MNLITTYGSFIISILLSFCRLSFLVVYFLCVKILSIPDNGLRNVDIIFQHSSINREWGGGGGGSGGLPRHMSKRMDI
jgi:hypothetical protein